MLKILLTTTSLFMLFSCSSMDMAAMQEQYKNENCNHEKGYETGRNDASEGKPMNSGWTGVCDPQDRKAAMAGYREGFDAESKGDDGDGVVVSAPGINIRVGSGQRQKNWVCEINVFGDSFSGFGPTKGRASDEARSKCTAKHNGVHCAPSCRIDR